MAELIRSAVELYIETDGGRQALGGTATGGENLGNIETTLRGIQNELEELETSVDALQREIESNQVDAGLQQAVFRSLPTRDELNDGQRGVVAGDVASSVDADRSQVAKALEILDDTTPSVQSEVFGDRGQRVQCYWREV